MRSSSAPNGVTEFQNRVYRVVAAIPRGRVVTYRDVALQAGCKSCRAVGQALKRNPFAPAVPCHRVIASDLTPGGFMGERDGRNIKRKIEMLHREGVEFKDDRLADPRRLHRFSDTPGISQKAD